jgi:hypothetical protein
LMLRTMKREMIKLRLGFASIENCPTKVKIEVAARYTHDASDADHAWKLLGCSQLAQEVDHVIRIPARFKVQRFMRVTLEGKWRTGVCSHVVTCLDVSGIPVAPRPRLQRHRSKKVASPGHVMRNALRSAAAPPRAALHGAGAAPDRVVDEAESVHHHGKDAAKVMAGAHARAPSPAPPLPCARGNATAARSAPSCASAAPPPPPPLPAKQTAAAQRSTLAQGTPPPPPPLPPKRGSAAPPSALAPQGASVSVQQSIIGPLPSQPMKRVHCDAAAVRVQPSGRADTLWSNNAAKQQVQRL